MDTAATELAQLKQKLAEQKQKLVEQTKLLEAQEAALLVVEQMLASQKSDPEFIHAGPSKPGPIMPLRIRRIRGKAFIDMVKDAVASLGNEEFTVADVEAAIIEHGHEIAGKAPRARIAMALSELVEKTIIERTAEGSGRTPHRFRKINRVNDSL